MLLPLALLVLLSLWPLSTDEEDQLDGPATAHDGVEAALTMSAQETVAVAAAVVAVAAGKPGEGQPLAATPGDERPAWWLCRLRTTEANPLAAVPLAPALPDWEMEWA